MFRSVAAVIFGYLGMAVWVMLSLSIAWKLLGRDFAVDPSTNAATAAWLALNLPLSFAGALLGGWLTASIARARAWAAVRALATLVLLLGLVLATGETQRDRAAPTPQSSEGAALPPVVQPLWYSFTIPFVGFLGVMVGGSIRRHAAGG